MERNRETRRACVSASNGVNTRRHGRTNTLSENPYGDGGVELQESARLRREGVKRDRERKRERRRDFREKRSRGKRRRGGETSDESFDEEDDEEDEDEDEDDEEIRTATARFSPPLSVSLPRRRLHRRKSFPVGSSSSSSSKDFRASPVWKSGDETFTPSVPRRPRSACTKRSRDWITSRSGNINGGVSDQILRQASTSPASQSAVVSSPPSNSFIKKLKPDENNTGPKQKPPKSSNPEKLEIEIAEVLFGLMTQSQFPSSNPRSSGGRKSSPASDPSPLQSVAPGRKTPGLAAEDPARADPPGPAETDPAPKSEVLSPDPEKVSSGETVGNSVILHEPEALIRKEDMDYQQESDAVKNDENDSPSIVTASSTSAVVCDTMTKPNSMVLELENPRIEKINLMAPPPLDSILSTDVSCGLSTDESEGKHEESKTKELDNDTRKICLHFDLETPGISENILQKHQEIPTKQKVEEEPLGCEETLKPVFSQPRPKRCATHYYIAKNIHRMQQLVKTGPLWELPSGPVGNVGPNHGPKDKGSQNACSFDSSSGPSNSMGPAIMFPLNHQIQHHQTDSSVLNGPPLTRIFLQSRLESKGKPVKSIYGPNFAMPVHSNQIAMSFGTISGSNGMEILSSHQNLGNFQSLPDGASASASASQPTMNQNTCNNRSQIQQHLKQQQQMVFPQSLSKFPQNHSISMAQYPQWKNCSRTSSPASSTLTSLKNPHSQNQIAFGGNSNVQTTLSPSNSTVSKGSSRTNSCASTNTKAGQAQSPIFSARNLHSNHSPSILGNPTPLQQQPHMFFLNPYPRANSPHSNSAGSTASGPNGIYMQQPIRAGPNQQHQISPMFSFTSGVGEQLLPAAGFSYVQLKPAEQK